ncbi:MAG TPA: hypothetical protein VLE99_03675 [Candidatus Saccharimonadales bacterium]|nr:hypothetical protein [Candidatus Saccharimonadales bacterium]
MKTLARWAVTVLLIAAAAGCHNPFGSSNPITITFTHGCATGGPAVAEVKGMTGGTFSYKVNGTVQQTDLAVDPSGTTEVNVTCPTNPKKFEHDTFEVTDADGHSQSADIPETS